MGEDIMGVYNEYGYKRIQLKVGSFLNLTHYKEKEKVDIPDGVYVGYGGIVVINEGILIATFSHLIDSRGDRISQDKLGY